MSDPDNPNKNLRLASRNIAFGLIAIVTQLFGTSFSFFIIARIPGISVSDFGMLTYAFAVAQLFAICFEYGLSSYLAKESAVNGKQDSDFEMSSYGLHLFLMGGGYALFIAALPILNISEQAVVVCKWIGGSVFLTSTLRFFLAFYQGREKLHLELFATLSEMFILVSVIGIAFIQGADVVTIAQYFFVGRLVAWGAAYTIFGTIESWLLPKFNWSTWRKILSESLPFALTFLIAFAITSIDTMMLQQMATDNPERQVGLYQAAMRLVLIPTIFAMAVTKVFLPQLARMQAENPHSLVINLRHLNNLLQTVGMLSGVFVIFYADKLVWLAYGTQYDDAVLLVQILGLTLMMRFGASYNLYFTLKGQMWLRVAFALIALIATIGFNYLLIARYGAVGVAYASVLAHLVYWIPFLIATKYYEGEFMLGWHWVRAILIAVIFVLLLALSAQLPFSINLIWSAAFIGGAAFFSLHTSLRKRLNMDLLRRRRL